MCVCETVNNEVCVCTFGMLNYTSTCLVFDDTPMGCLDIP